MKQILLLLLFSCPVYSFTQADSSYQALIAKAGLSHLQKDYKKAIIYFEKAFALEQPDALSAYKAAGAYALDSNNEKAFHYLELSLKSGWTEADWLSFDPYFDFLRNSLPEKWKDIEQIFFIEEKQYENSLKLPLLRKQINLLTLTDQKLRYKKIQATTKAERQQLNQLIYQSDSLNLAEAKKIIQQHGWPKLSDIGKDGQNNLWLIVQHADHDVLFQQEALAAMKKLIPSRQINLENYAFLYDRVQCNLNYKQYYGTQVNWTTNGEASGFRAISKEDLADKRRKALGLLPLNIYSLSYGFSYSPVTANKAKQNESADRTQVKTLIDSANTSYRKKEFQQVYDLYNNASMIMGGMSSADNYEAAVIFSKIAMQNKEQHYIGIALDFLNLLYLRKELTKTRLARQAEFRILDKEPRWIAMYQQLK